MGAFIPSQIHYVSANLVVRNRSAQAEPASINKSQLKNLDVSFLTASLKNANGFLQENAACSRRTGQSLCGKENFLEPFLSTARRFLVFKSGTGGQNANSWGATHVFGQGSPVSCA
jgi:hypothetical protein